jgi:hypothetical protein
LWDRVWAIKPDLPAGNAWQPPLLPGSARLFATILLQNVLLRHCPAEKAFADDWRFRLEYLFLNKLPAAPQALAKMDLPADWQKHPLWI